MLNFLRRTYKLQPATYCVVYVYVSISHGQKLPLTIIFPSEVIYPEEEEKIGMITFSDKRMNLSIGNRVCSWNALHDKFPIVCNVCTTSNGFEKPWWRWICVWAHKATPSIGTRGNGSVRIYSMKIGLNLMRINEDYHRNQASNTFDFGKYTLVWHIK